MYKYIIVCSFFALVVTGCATKQAYDGEKLPADKVARIYQSKPQKLEDGKLFLYIEVVDDKVVGDKVVGYPSYVDVLPGERKIKVIKYLHTFGKALLQGLGVGLGGAVGGVLAAGGNHINTPSNTIVDEVKEGKKYIINFKSLDGTSNNIDIFLEDYSDKK